MSTLVHHRIFSAFKSTPKSAYIRNKLVQIGKKGKNFALSLQKKVYRLEKSTPPPVVAVVTNISYVVRYKISHCRDIASVSIYGALVFQSMLVVGHGTPKPVQVYNVLSHILLL